MKYLKLYEQSDWWSNEDVPKDPFGEKKVDRIPKKTYDRRGREIVNLADICPYNYLDDMVDFDVIEEKQSHFDGEKGSVRLDCIIKRLSDGKYFKFSYVNWGRGERDLREQTAYEVQRKEKVIYYYE